MKSTTSNFSYRESNQKPRYVWYFRDCFIICHFCICSILNFQRFFILFHKSFSTSTQWEIKVSEMSTVYVVHFRWWRQFSFSHFVWHVSYTVTLILASITWTICAVALPKHDKIDYCDSRVHVVTCDTYRMSSEPFTVDFLAKIFLAKFHT